MTKQRAHRPAGEKPVPACLCGSTRPYPECCGPLHRGERAAATAEELMRSRFSAFAVGDSAYLLRTWHASTRPARIVLDPARRWTRLEVLATDRGGMFDTVGTVEFDAHYRWQGHAGTQHENSRFVRQDGDWVYVGE
jgi:SEC-C motif domain protein